MPKDTKQVNDNLYIGKTFKVWREGPEWRFKTFGRCRRVVDGRASDLKLAMGCVMQCL